MSVVALLAAYQNINVDQNWDDVVALFSCDGIRWGVPRIVFGTNSGWCVRQTFNYPPISPTQRTYYYFSSTVDGEYQYTGKYTDDLTNMAFSSSPPLVNSNIAIARIIANKTLLYPSEFAQVPIDITNPAKQPGMITTNITLHDAVFLGTNGTDFYAFGSISDWTSPNQVYKSSDDGVTWTSVGTMSGATFPAPIGGSSVANFGNGRIQKIGSRWFLVFVNAGFAGEPTSTRIFYTDSTNATTGWTACSGATVDPENIYESYSSNITYDGIDTFYVCRSRRFYIDIMKSTDGGATWTVDYTYPRDAAANGGQIVSFETTSPTVGGRIRGVNSRYIFEHTIGAAAGTWTINANGLTYQNYFAEPELVTGYYANYLNSGGIQGGYLDSVNVFMEGAVYSTNSPTANFEKNGSPYYLMGQASYLTAFAYMPAVQSAYPLSYVDTSFYKFGTVPGKRGFTAEPGSLRCNGGLSYVFTSSEWNFTNVDWTIECWMYTSTANQVAAVLNNLTGGGGSFYPYNFGLNNGKLCLYGYTAAGTLAYSLFEVATLPLNSWNFIAFQRSGNTITLYLNGISIATASLTPGVSLYWDSSPFNIGAYNDNSYPFDGWLDDIRITKGVARYSGNFDVPWRAFADQGP